MDASLFVEHTWTKRGFFNSFLTVFLRKVRRTFLRKRAAAIGYEDPINKDYNATTEMYHSCLNQILNEWRERGNRVAVMVASHNADSIKYAVKD